MQQVFLKIKRRGCPVHIQLYTRGCPTFISYCGSLLALFYVLSVVSSFFSKSPEQSRLFHVSKGAHRCTKLLGYVDLGLSQRESDVRHRRYSPWNGHVAVITLDAIKAQHLERKLTGHHISNLVVHKIKGVDGSCVDVNNLLISGFLSRDAAHSIYGVEAVHGEKLTYGSLGCFLAHVEAWRLAASSSKPLLVLEEDVELLPPFGRMLPVLTKRAPKNFSLLYFANIVGDPVLNSVSEYDKLFWRMHGEHWGTYCYLISPQMATYLLSMLKNISVQVDSFLIQHGLLQNFGVYLSKMQLVSTDNLPNRKSLTQRQEAARTLIPHRLIVVGVAIPDFIQLQFAKAGWSVERHPSNGNSDVFALAFKIGGVAISNKDYLTINPYLLMKLLSTSRVIFYSDHSTEVVNDMFAASKDRDVANAIRDGALTEQNLLSLHEGHPDVFAVIPLALLT